MATTVSNATIDTAAAAVAAPYGPLTRVTSVATLPTPNSDIRLEFTGAVAGSTVFMTYEQLLRAAQLAEKLRVMMGAQDRVQNIKTLTQTLDTAVDAMTLPHTYADLKALRTHLRNLEAQLNLGGF